MPDSLDDQPETIDELVLRFQIELWEIYSEMEAKFAEIVRDVRKDLQQIYADYFFD